jgi:hypothetical protein
VTGGKENRQGTVHLLSKWPHGMLCATTTVRSVLRPSHAMPVSWDGLGEHACVITECAAPTWQPSSSLLLLLLLLLLPPSD